VFVVEGAEMEGKKGQKKRYTVKNKNKKDENNVKPRHENHSNEMVCLARDVPPDDFLIDCP
jgi:hypothetical protein